jgi:uncharacterized protein
MHIDVTNLLAENEGTRTDFSVEGERPEFEDITLTQPVSGSVQIMRAVDGLTARGNLQTTAELECHRCLRTFEQALKFPLSAEFRETPQDDEFSIDGDGQIDLSEAIRQEILVHLPQQQLCQEDCKGIQLKQKKDRNGST